MIIMWQALKRFTKSQQLGSIYKFFILWPSIGFFLGQEQGGLFYSISCQIWISTAIRLNSFHKKTGDPSTSLESTVYTE